MGSCYDIYGLSYQRDKQTIERFLDHYADRDAIEDTEGQGIYFFKNEKYNSEDGWIEVDTLTEVIDFGVLNEDRGFAFYINDHLKEGIAMLILQFTYDGKVIFGVSIEDARITENGVSEDQHSQALVIAQQIAVLTNAQKTSVQFENTPVEDEEGFDEEVKFWERLIVDETGRYRLRE